MKKSTFRYVLIFALCNLAYGNMAQPIRPGTLGANPFVSEYVDISKEDLYIRLNNDFQSAYIKATYYINVQKEGEQIPLLFYASNYQESFEVKVDGKKVNIQEIPDEYKIPKNTPFQNFDYIFKPSGYSDQSVVEIKKDETSGNKLELKDLKYFTTDLSVGTHIIEVSYLSTKWTDTSDWVNEYSIRYSLSPAKYWKSFGNLNVTVDFKDFPSDFKTNLGPSHESTKSTYTWHFNDLPAEVLTINYQPKTSLISSLMIGITPYGAALIFALLLGLGHWRWIRKRKQIHPNKNYFWNKGLGGVLVTILVFAFWLLFIKLTFNSLGEHAGNGINVYGQIIIPIFLSPVFLVLYIMILNIVLLLTQKTQK